MSERRKLYTGEESAERGLFLLRRAAIAALLLTALFIVLFDRAKHDPGLAGINPFAEDPYDSVGSFGTQLAFACAVIASIRAFRTDLKAESLSNRYTYTLRAIAVSQLAIIVTMLADLSALARFSSLWSQSQNGYHLPVLAGGLLLLALGFCFYLIHLAKRREVCSKNPVRQPQFVPFLIVFALLEFYPVGWRDGTIGAILTAAIGMIFLFYSVFLLSKAMFPCPDIPEKDLVDDLYGFYLRLAPRSRHHALHADADEQDHGFTGFRSLLQLVSPRKREWNLLALIAFLAGVLLACAEIFSEGQSRGAGQDLLVVAVFIGLESAGIILGYALLRRFLGIIRLTK